jgi:hypothetical protein
MVRETKVFGKNPVLMPLSEPQIPHELAGGEARTSAETVGQQTA